MIEVFGLDVDVRLLGIDSAGEVKSDDLFYFFMKFFRILCDRDGVQVGNEQKGVVLFLIIISHPL